MELLKNLPFESDWEKLCEKLHLDEDDAEDFLPVYRAALAVANPKAAFSCCDVRVEGETTVYVGETRFDSELLAKNFKNLTKVYPFVITAGKELHDAAQSEEDPVMRFWIEEVAEDILRSVTGGVFDAIRQKYNTEAKYTVNPGSLPQWPISNQKPLFALLGDVEGEIGVTLTPSMLMVPKKSVSGILFEAEEEYSNCALCTRFDCPSRRSPYHG